MPQSSWVVALLSCLAVLTLPSLGQDKPTAPPSDGTVTGIVLNSDGDGIPNANVYALLANNMKQRFGALTDDEGKFTISKIPVSDECNICRTIYVQAYKDSDGYPDKLYAFYHTVDTEVAKVEIHADKAPPFVTLKMGPKTAYLKMLISAEDGTPLGATVTFTRDGFPHGIYKRGVGSSETIPVPTAPFRMTVEVDGYDPWHYGGPYWQGDAGVITPKSGETVSVLAMLHKK